MIVIIINNNKPYESNAGLWVFFTEEGLELIFKLG